MSDDVTAEAMNAVVAEILGHDDLAPDRDWDSYALVAEVTDDAEIMAAFRYTESGPPVPSQTLVDSRPLRRLREATRGADDQPWRVCIVKIRRDGAQATWDFLAGDDATPWEVTTRNHQNLAHGLRPQPGDFPPGAEGTPAPRVRAAAADGRVDQLSDLLGRGASPNEGHGANTPYRLAMAGGHVDAMRLLHSHGARLPRGVGPPDALPDAVVLRMYAPTIMWWLAVLFVVLAIVAAVAGEPIVAGLLIAIPLLGIVATDAILAMSSVAIDGPLLARRRGLRWVGPIDLRRLDAVGYAPHANIRAPAFWTLGQRVAGRPPGSYERRAFPPPQLAALAAADTRFVEVPAARGFMSPGFERLLSPLVDPAATTIAPAAAERLRPP